MNDNDCPPITDAGILAAMRAVNPPLEKLMEERLALRIENRETRVRLGEALVQVTQLQYTRDWDTLRYITEAKRITLLTACVALAALATAMFTHLLSVTLTAPLLSSLLLPLWIVDYAETKLNAGNRIAIYPL